MSVVAQADVLQPGFDRVTLATITGRTRAFGMGMADFNGDNIDDIISGDTYGDVHLFLGNGDGTLTDAGIVINQVYHNAYATAAGDFNGDTYQDFVLTMRDDFSDTDTIINSGEIHLYPGNGNGTFQSSGFPQEGLLVGDAGTASMAVAAGDVDGDSDTDIIASDVTVSANNLADIILYRNTGNNAGNQPIWAEGETIASGQDLGYNPDPDSPPYYPPKIASSLHAYGLALGDLDGDNDLDLVVTDIASYLYIYQNNGSGSFSPIRYNNISTGTRPYAYVRVHETFTSKLSVSCGDLNGDGLVDIVTGGSDGEWDGVVDLWLNTGNDASGRPQFLSAGNIGSGGTDARGLTVGQVNPSQDSFLDVVFGNFEGTIYGLLTDREDTDGDGIIDFYDNAPLHSNAPRLDMNIDGGRNYLDQLDNDHDAVGDPADDDDDNDGISDANDNCPYEYNPDQTDTDGDSLGDECDPLNNLDSDGDGTFDGPIDPCLALMAKRAKAIWSQSDTHFIIRIDALGRLFQNEFTQVLTDGAILSPAEWEAKKFDSYNGIGDDPADPGYQIPADLPGGMEVPITLVVIPKDLWESLGDPDPIRWINDRNSSPNLEIGQHGTYHANNTLLGDWADNPDINWYSCETCGFGVDEMYQYLRIGTRILLGRYADDPWILDAGADPCDPNFIIDWSDAANPLLSYAPPFNASDTNSREATAHLYMPGFSASIYEENSSVFTPEGSNHEMFDQFGMFHASADLQVDPEDSLGGMTFGEYLLSITEFGSLNTWLIEEVEWSSRYCDAKPRLANCPSAPGGINRENNMVSLDRWDKWMTLLDFVKTHGQPMTLGQYSLAAAFDNAPTVPNPDQTDTDHDGIGDGIGDATLVAVDTELEYIASNAEGVLKATLSSNAIGLENQEVTFSFDIDGNAGEEQFTAITDVNGVAEVNVVSTLASGTITIFSVSWDGIVLQLAADANLAVVDNCPFTADFTGDCRVDEEDLSLMVEHWLKGESSPPCLLKTEMAGGDCFIDFADYSKFALEWLNR
ncbi:MAG: FG-GAP-like repeat-containing protein [Planctomycetota bacterium]